MERMTILKIFCYLALMFVASRIEGGQVSFTQLMIFIGVATLIEVVFKIFKLR